MNTLGIGKIIEGAKTKDAIHVAVAPVVAGESLCPGDKVRFHPSGEVVYSDDDSIGVVDPFLKVNLRRGQMFWLFLYPDTVTGLHHEWEHPAFFENTTKVSKEESEKWLREYACKLKPSDVEKEGEDFAFQCLLEDLENYELSGHGTDLNGLYELEEADDLKHHAQIYLGREIDWENFEFTCSC